MAATATINKKFLGSKASSVFDLSSVFAAKCRKKNKLWEDPDFPAEKSSLYLHDGSDVTWKRPGVN